MTSLGALASALLLATVSGPAIAQANQDASGQASGLQDIIVTAQKREESLQDVPVSVSALGRNAIENLQVQNFDDLAGVAPNVVTTPSTSGSNPTITIRGIIGNNVEPGKDSGVALYVDGVYISRTTGATFDVADLERVEILRGPQGTLYGRNSTGGAINYITAAPKGKSYARQEISIGNLGRLRTKTRIDLPSFGAFSVAGSFLHDEQDGWVRNTRAGLAFDFSEASRGLMPGLRRSADRLGSRNSEAGQIAVRYAPDSLPLTVDYKFDRTHAQYTNRGQQVLFDVATPAVPFLGLTRNTAPTLERLDALPMGFTTPERLDVFGHSLTVTADLTDNLQFKSISGYRGYRADRSTDVAGGGFEDFVNPFDPSQSHFAILGFAGYERERTYSQELQLSYNSELVDAIGGLYYFKQHTKALSSVYVFQFLRPDLPPPASLTNAEDRNKSMAAFAQATVHLTPEIDVTGGLRYTKDKRRQGPASVLPTDPPATPFSAKFDHLDWTANVSYRPSQDVTLYARAGTGYLSGGVFNNRAFEPEELFQYEVGAKTDLLDRRLRLNLSAFRSHYNDLQQSANNPNPPFLYQTFNVGKARITGAEVELTALPVKGLTLTANYGYTKFEYLSFVVPGFGDITDIAYENFYRPKHTIALGADYQLPEFGNGMVPSVSVNARYRSNQQLSLTPGDFQMINSNPSRPFQGLPLFTPEEIAQAGAVDRFIGRNAMWNIDARATLANIPISESKAKISVWVRNATNQRKIVAGGFYLPGLAAAQFAEPRTYGVDFGIEF